MVFSLLLYMLQKTVGIVLRCIKYNDSMNIVDTIIDRGNKELFSKIKENEDKIDDLCFKYREIEIARMRDDRDEAESGVIYSELLIDIERIGDHIMNIAESLCDSYEGQ